MIRNSVLSIFLLQSEALSSFSPPSTATIMVAHPTLSVIAVGDSSGTLSFFDPTFSGISMNQYHAGALDILDIRWNPVFPDIVVSVSADNLVVARKFYDPYVMASIQSKSIRHNLPILSVNWDPASGDRILVGSALGFVDRYLVSFAGVTGQSDMWIHPSGDRLNRWNTGCRVSFLYQASSVLILAGCDEGTLWFISPSQATPVQSITLPRRTDDPSPRAMFKDARGYVVALFDDTVSIVDVVNAVVVSSFQIRPRPLPNSHPSIGDSKVLSIDVSFLSNTEMDKLLVRTSDGVLSYDISGIRLGSVPKESWYNGTSFTDLMTMGAEVIHETSRFGDESNNPLIDLNETTGAIDVTACRNDAAAFAINQEKTDITCGPNPPVVEVDIVLPLAFDYIEGSFKLQSLGAIPAMDCTALKAPITQWTSAQQSQWTKVMPSTRAVVNDAYCPVVSENPSSSKLSTVEGCKTACMQRPECNMVFMRIRSDVTDNQLQPDSTRLIESCTFHRCSDPSIAPTVSTIFTEIWTLTTDMHPRMDAIDYYGGYVAFGTPDTVIHGGCAGTNGLIPTTTGGLTVSIVGTNISYPGSSAIRFQVSQYNAEAAVRIKGLALNIHVPYANYDSFIELPSSAPGGYYLADPGVRGSPRGPIAWSTAGVFTTAGNTTIVKI